MVESLVNIPNVTEIHTLDGKLYVDYNWKKRKKKEKKRKKKPAL